MKSKIIVVCTLLFIILCSISVVSAQDINNDTQITYDNTVNDVSTTQPILSEQNEASITNNNESDDVLLADSSEGSFSDLQTAINGARGGSVITLDNDYKSTQSSSIRLDKSLTIDGQGHTLDCDKKCSAFESKSGHITLKDLIIKNSYGVATISITGSARYTIINCSFIDNKGSSVIYNNVEGGSLIVTSSKFDNNSPGGIYSKGEVYVEDSKFTSNAAAVGGGINCEKSVYLNSSSFSSNKGGAIFAKGQIFAENCNFTNNNAKTGGAINGKNNIFIYNCTFTGNKAEKGGAIHKTNDGNVVISHSRFTNNEANDDPGGAIYTTSQITIENSEFSENSAKSKGGAIYSEYILFEGKSSFSHNHANGHGGAIYTDKIAKNVNDLYFEYNHADSDYGGAIYINSKCGDVNFNNLTFIKNYAYAGDGGAVYSDSGSTNLNLYNCVFTENYACGGIAKRYGGAVRSCGNINVYGSTFNSNWAENHGGAIYSSTANHVENSVFISNYVQKGDGGAIYINNRGTSSISKNYFQSNKAKDRGGAIYTDSISINLNLNNNAFISNNADNKGTAVFNSGNFNIDGNWWGTNSPSFNNQLMEYHTWPRSDESHSDKGYNTVSISSDSRTYNNMAATIKITFKNDVPKYLLENMKISSDKEHIIGDKKITGKTLEITYIPLEVGTHKITITPQNLKHELKSEFISVYGYDLVKTDGDSATYSATFKDRDGNFLKPGEKVIFTLNKENDKEYIHTVSEGGIATFNEVLRLQPGTYQVTAHNNITKESFTNKITILPRTYTYNISDYFIIQLFKNNDSISYENENITFKIANKTFVSTVTNNTAYFRFDVAAGEYTLDIYHGDQLIKRINDVKVLNQYSTLPISLNGENYAALMPIHTNEKFIREGNVTYSEIGENMRRYVFLDDYGAIIYNVTISNSGEFADVLRKISDKSFRADVIILNLKPGTYKISQSFYKDQEHKYLIHLTTGNLFINGNGAVIEDGYNHNFIAMESGTQVSIQGLTFKTFYRVFVNQGNLYCVDCTFSKNDAWNLLTDTPGSVIYNKNQATFQNCIFDHNANDVMLYEYNPDRKATIYAESNSLTNLVNCQFTIEDTIHAVDGSMVILYGSNELYDMFTNDTRNTFEFGSCLDCRRLDSYNVNRTSEYYCESLDELISMFYTGFEHEDASNFMVNLAKGDYSIDVKTYTDKANPFDFRTFNRYHNAGTHNGPNDDFFADHNFLFDVGSRPIVINGNGAKISLTGSSDSAENHFAFVPRYSSLTLINLTISGFNSAIVNYGQLILINCTLKDNKIHYSRIHTFEAEKGGAIRNYGSVYCYNTTFSNNRATEGAAYYSKGISAYGQFYNCKFEGNTLISNLIWNNKNANDLFADGGSIIKIAKCIGIRDSTIKKSEDALILYRDTIDVTICNYTVDSLYSLMKLSNLVNNNHDYDIINVTFVKGDYGTFSNSKILFDIDYGELIFSGNGARVFVNSPKDNDETQFLVTTSRSSVIITGLTIEGFNIAIENKGALNIVDSSFINNRVDYIKKKDYGGAIVNNKGALLTGYNTTFKDNYAKYGGAIYNLGTAKVLACMFVDNKGYDNKNINVDIYNHNASVSIITIGDSPNVINHFPMAAWKQKAITAIIMTTVAVVSGGAGLGVSAAVASGAQLVGLAIGIGVGAMGGTLDAFIYSNDNQDYGQFLNRVKDGVLIGIRAATLGMAINNVITYGSHVPNTDEALIEKTDVSVHEFLSSAEYNAAQKFLYNERVSFHDIDNIIAADDSFKFSNEL
ncbi:right-handed parallel beta-helix repeat-containing protein [uncultured Methanobrevibacter sp.]|uniref:right-handed parallel beta-helix repeat-containing protein n=1 Tax=uncultured Methanobrevibacter sp. TaxID=253161 RepID=UPI0025EA5550|nr:right-handed parallel beta-helix repeat-containing protein [uncultured Methanobrevibacter sp.]